MVSFFVTLKVFYLASSSVVQKKKKESHCRSPVVRVFGKAHRSLAFNFFCFNELLLRCGSLFVKKRPKIRDAALVAAFDDDDDEDDSKCPRRTAPRRRRRRTTTRTSSRGTRRRTLDGGVCTNTSWRAC